MIKTITIFLILFGFAIISGCNKNIDQIQIQKSFVSDYKNNLKKYDNYNLSGWYIDASGKNYISDMHLKFSWYNIYINKNPISLACDKNQNDICGIYWLVVDLDISEIFKFSNKNTLDLDINKKYISNILNTKITAQNKNFAKISSENIDRIGKYIYQNSQTILDIQKLKIKDIYIVGQLWSGLLDIKITKWLQNFYIDNKNLGMHIYSSGLLDLMISKIN